MAAAFLFSWLLGTLSLQIGCLDPDILKWQLFLNGEVFAQDGSWLVLCNLCLNLWALPWWGLAMGLTAVAHFDAWL